MVSYIDEKLSPVNLADDVVVDSKNVHDSVEKLSHGDGCKMKISRQTSSWDAWSISRLKVVFELTH